jgi:SEC-C motif-containing protein
MRSRYSAFVVQDVGYVEKTHDPDTRKDGFDRAGAEKWSKESEWKGLQIVATKDGGEGDEKGVVSFRALFSTGGQDYVHQEISTFRRSKGNWVFVDGVSPKAETFERKGPDVGRNDPCHCGSGKKFKKCHGRA